MKKWVLLLWMVFLCGVYCGKAEEIRRTHAFIRPLAMGGAFTAVADSGDTIAYNPAGLLMAGEDGVSSFPLIWYAYNETIKQVMNQSLEFNLEESDSLAELKGERAYLELQMGFPFLYLPRSGIFLGLSGDAWLDFSFPQQSVIPLVHLEAVAQTVAEYGMAFQLWETGWRWGFNLKTIKRMGLISDVNPIRIANLIDTPNELIEAYNPNPPPAKLVLDLGLLYRFDHPWDPRLGISVLDAAAVNLEGDIKMDSGGVDYGSAGAVEQLSSLGAAFTYRKSYLDLTVSFDMHDITFSYFAHNDLRRRLAIGGEAAFRAGLRRTRLLAFQAGLRELKYPAFGVKTGIGFLSLNAAQWRLNLGTADHEKIDTQYMLLVSFDF